MLHFSVRIWTQSATAVCQGFHDFWSSGCPWPTLTFTIFDVLVIPMFFHEIQRICCFPSHLCFAPLRMSSSHELQNWTHFHMPQGCRSEILYFSKWWNTFCRSFQWTFRLFSMLFLATLGVRYYYNNFRKDLLNFDLIQIYWPNHLLFLSTTPKLQNDVWNESIWHLVQFLR